MVIDMGDGVLLKPRAPFVPTSLSDVAGMFKQQVSKKTDTQIEDALEQEIRGKWRGSD